LQGGVCSLWRAARLDPEACAEYLSPNLVLVRLRYEYTTLPPCHNLGPKYQCLFLGLLPCAMLCLQKINQHIIPLKAKASERMGMTKCQELEDAIAQFGEAQWAVYNLTVEMRLANISLLRDP